VTNEDLVSGELMNTIRIAAILLFSLFLGGITFASLHGSAEKGAGGDDKSGGYAIVYSGPGSAEECPEAAADIAKEAGLKVKFVSDAGKLPGLLDSAEVFILGGTDDEMRPLVKAFAKVSEALKSYLKRGGRYLGICGGGFMASMGWDEDGVPMKGLSIIPASSSVYNDDFSARIIPVTWMGKSRQLFFKAGPVFHLSGSRPDVRIVANYSDGSIAALICAYGKGRAAVVGPHPEARESWKDEAVEGNKWTSSKDLAVSLLRELLSPGDSHSDGIRNSRR